MIDLTKVATVLEAAASLISATETEKRAEQNAQRTAEVTKLAAQYKEATGEDLPESMRQKLASSDKDVVGLIRGLAEKQAGTVESMGGPSAQRDTNSQPTTVKEAAVKAEERFLDWLTS